MKILVFDRWYKISTLIKEILDFYGYETIIAEMVTDISDLIKSESPDVLVLGTVVSGGDTFLLLDSIRAEFPDLPIIYHTSLSDLWTEALRHGATFACDKSGDFTRMINIIKDIEKHKNKQAASPG